MSKRLPKMKNDPAAKWVLKKDLSGHMIPENFKLNSFEFAPKKRSITLRVSNELLDAVRNAAKKRGVNYQKLIRDAIEQFLKRAA